MKVKALLLMFLLWTISAVLSVVIIESWLLYKPVSVSITIKGNQRDSCKIYYAGRKGFNEKETIHQNYGLPNIFKRFEFNLPAKEITALQINPGKVSDRFEIVEISINVGTTRTTWKKEGIQKGFSLKNLAVSDSLHGQNLIIHRANSKNGILVLHQGFFKIHTTVCPERARRWYLVLGMIHLVGLLVILLFHRRLASNAIRAYQWLKDEEKLRQFTERVKIFFHQNLAIIIIAFFLAIFSYGYELFNFTLSIDDETGSFLSASETINHILTGRWGSYFLNFFLSPHAVLPYFPILLTLCSLAIVAILFTTSEKFSLSASIIFSIIFITHPLHSYYLAFNTPFFGIGMVFATLAYLIVRHSLTHQLHKHALWLLATLLLTFALSIYQALLSFFMVLSAYLIFNQFIIKKDGLKKIWHGTAVPLALITLGSLFLFKTGDLVVKFLFLYEMPIKKFEYIDSMIFYGTEPLLTTFMRLAWHIVKFTFGIGSFGGEVGIAQNTVFLMLGISIYRIARDKTNHFSTKSFAIILLSAILISAFSVSLALGNPMPPRTYMAIPLMTAILWLITVKNSGRLLTIGMSVFALIILLNNTYINTRLFYASYVSWQADRDLAIMVLDRVEQLNPPFIDGKIKVAFAGPHQYEQNELFFSSDTHGASFFEWGKGRSNRIEYLYKTMGINHLNVISLKHVSNYREKLAKMPFWPLPGSVVLSDSVVLVNFTTGD